MKKSMVLCCSALLALAVFADEPAPSAEAAAPKAPHAERGPRGPRADRGPRKPPLMLLVTDKTTDEDLAAFKKQVAEKIDASYAEYKAKAAPEGEEKAPLHMGLMVMERRPGMGPFGPRGERGPRGEQGPRGGRGPRRGGEGPKPAPEAK